jgi:hypothetical protein
MSKNTTSRMAESENIESESRESESGSVCPKSKMARTASSVKDSQKKKRSSSTKSRQEELENKLESLEKTFQGLEHNIGEKRSNVKLSSAIAAILNFISEQKT